ncbi:MAG: hypothetical protein ACRDQ1_05225 [Sciscionella sp.]
MSDFPDPDYVPVDHSRRRALWGLAVLGCLALIIGGLMVLLGSGSGAKKKDNIGLDGPAVTTISTPSSTNTETHRTTGAATTHTSTTPSSHPRTGNPCTTGSSCTVDGDGGLVAQLNVYRAKHGQQAVPGKVSSQAQKCALAKGNGPNCAPHWIVTVSPTQDGATALGKMASFNGKWLLDSKISSVDVGWAYSGGSYQCVILKTLTTD